MPFRGLAHEIKATLGPRLLAGRGVVQFWRKSLELIMRKVCTAFGGETAGQQDIVKIKAWGKEQA